jgi:hypothetical protein
MRRCRAAAAAAVLVPASLIAIRAAVVTADARPLLDAIAAGGTVPDTNYAVPAGAIYLDNSPPAHPSGPHGSITHPYARLTPALDRAPSGGTLVVRGGVYRDWYHTSAQTAAVLQKGVTIQAAAHEHVWFDGSDRFAGSSWRADGGGRWSRPWSTPNFCDGHYYTYRYDQQPATNPPCAYPDEYAGTAAGGDPQMVFVGGNSMQEVASLAAATHGAFYYDWSARRIYISTDPNTHQVLVAKRPLAIFAGNSATGMRLRGIGVRRYATVTNSGSPQAGAIAFRGARSVLADDVFTQMAGWAAKIGSDHGLVKRSVFKNNGFSGLASTGQAGFSNGTDNLRLLGNMFSRNNRAHLGSQCTVACEAAAVKLTHMNGFTASYNVFSGTLYGAGLWCDVDCHDGVIVRNVAKGNGTDGLYQEVSDNAIFASNLTVGNGQHGIRCLCANTKIFNNTMVDDGQNALWVYDDDRTHAGDPANVATDPVNDVIKNNIEFGGNAATLAATTTAHGNKPSAYVVAMDYNTYYRRSTARIIVQWIDSPSAPPSALNFSTLSAFLAAHPKYEAHHPQDLTGPTPVFVDLAHGNYHVAAASPAHTQPGAPLPADVAAAISIPGVSAGSVLDRGAIRWPGS